MHQANCPFKAFAKSRLKAEKPPEKVIGLNPMQRGILVHDILQAFWEKVQSQQQLKRLGGQVATVLQEIIQSTLAKHKRTIRLSEIFWEIEGVRLFDIMQSVILFESGRPSFKVVATEQSQHMDLGYFQCRVRIDRIDEVQGGAFLLIDYKTGLKNINDIVNQPLHEPQLPLYLQSKYPTQPTALAWFTIEKENPIMIGVSETELQIKKITAVEKLKQDHSWSSLSAQWTDNLKQLASDIVEGKAAVAPIDGAKTCRLCDLQSLCRINEIAVET